MLNPVNEVESLHDRECDKRMQDLHAAQYVVIDDSPHPTYAVNVYPLCDTNVIPDTEQDDIPLPAKAPIGRKLVIKQHRNDGDKAPAAESSALKAL